MANNTIRSCLYFLFFILFAFCIQQHSCNHFHILKAPKYLHFTSDAGSLSTNDINHVLANAFSFSTDKNIQWHGLRQTSLFHRPKANIMFIIPGITNQLQSTDVSSLASYPLSSKDIPYLDTGEFLTFLQSEFVDQTPLTVDLSFDQSRVLLHASPEDVLTSVPASVENVVEEIRKGGFFADLKSLNISDEADSSVLAEFQTMWNVISQVASHADLIPTKTPDFYFFTLPHFGNYVKSLDLHSEKVKDAMTVFTQTINKIIEVYKKLYKENVLIELVTFSSDDAPKVRVARSLKATKTNPAPSTAKTQLGVSPDYDDDFPVIFNIILWLMVALVVAMYVIAHSIWFMDPGRDSIIYRMTSNRMKKDN